MTNTMQGYLASNPSAATMRMRELRNYKAFCPMCGRVAKWAYPYYEPTSQHDTDKRCTLHEIVPIPGPAREPDHYKVEQLY